VEKENKNGGSHVQKKVFGCNLEGAEVVPSYIISSFLSVKR